MLYYRSGNESNYRTAAYEAIVSYLSHATPDALTVVQNTTVTILERMEHLLGLHVCIASKIAPYIRVF